MWRRGRRLLATLGVAAVALGASGCGGDTTRGGHPTHSVTTRTTVGPVTSTRTTAGPATTTSPAGSEAGAPVTYGIADAPGQFARCTPTDPDCCTEQSARCDLGEMSGYFDNPRFLKLLTPVSAHRIRDVRLFVPYDAVEAFNGSTRSPGCVYSRVREQSWSVPDGEQAPGEAIDELVAGIIQARAEGLTPVVSIAGYPFPSGRPAWDPPIADPTTTSGYWAYRCGVQGILSELSRLPAWEQPHLWEAINEPEAFAIFRGSDAAPATGCDVGSEPQPDGPAKAACDEAIASTVIHGFAGHADDSVIAGTFQHPYVGYLGAYVTELARQMPGARFPGVWSVHDYPEVTDAYAVPNATELARFDAALARDTGGRAHSLWITEAGAVLTSTVRSGDCPAVGVDTAGSLGACINGQAARQAAGARAFFKLPHVAAAVPITHLFWYQFTGAPHWDSGLVDPTGVPRAAYCVFYGHGDCTGNPYAD